MRIVPFIPLFIVINLRWLQPVPFGPPGLDELEVSGVRHHPIGKSLVDMEVGDTVRIFIESIGCFHFGRGTIILSRERADYVATVRFDDLNTSIQATGVRRLTPAEIAELDLTLAIIRPGTPGSYCTTTTSYQIAWGNGAELLVDSDCRLARRESENERVPTLSFTSLLWDVSEPLYQERRQAGMVD